MKRQPMTKRNKVFVHEQHGPYGIYSEECGYYTLYSIVNRRTGFAILHHKVETLGQGIVNVQR